MKHDNNYLTTVIHPLCLCFLLLFVACAGGRETGREGEKGEFPTFVPNASKPEYDEAELRSHIRYPEKAVREDLEGTIRVKAYIDKDGVVGDVTVISRSGIDSDILDKAVIEAVRKTRFTPAEQNGYPVPMTMSFTVRVDADD